MYLNKRFSTKSISANRFFTKADLDDKCAIVLKISWPPAMNSYGKERLSVSINLESRCPRSYVYNLKMLTSKSPDNVTLSQVPSGSYKTLNVYISHNCLPINFHSRGATSVDAHNVTLKVERLLMDNAPAQLRDKEPPIHNELLTNKQSPTTKRPAFSERRYSTAGTK
ncbi:unnamed protein product [Nesidiocoris tenuis]|uniref:Uncharacterized protein n=1 Tax=Nesidiocoris tenuis TaxID=355587 RepID=A0A6H5HQ04_9HEMI|nr:unnamed protein product [Nesidiocoris tenuis]